MPLDSNLLEILLYEEDGVALDFISAQYPFENATIAEKAELLKDILAFTNSWRRTTAYILIGVQEVKGGRSNVVGVRTHLEDASLHQFVNEKTQRPVEFSYQAFGTEGPTIGAIEIPFQKRPIYLKRKFDGLRERDFFIRDGSSTRVATPDEIASMGAEEVIGSTPELTLQWAGLANRDVFPSPLTIHSVILEPRLPTDTFAPRSNRPLGTDLGSNPDYSAEVIAYTAGRAYLTALGLRLRNRSGVAAKRIRFVGRVVKAAGLVIKDHIDDPPPKKSHDLISFVSVEVS